jgi:hypothetical protein
MLLQDAEARLRAVLEEEGFLRETPIEVITAMELALEAIQAALGHPEPEDLAERRCLPPEDQPAGRVSSSRSSAST